MPQLPSSAKARAFYRMTFELREKNELVYSHTMMLNPGELSLNNPARITATQTLGGAYISDFGEGLLSFTISGTTGFNARIDRTTGQQRDGYTEWKLLRDKLYRYYVTNKSVDVELMWFHWEDGEFYRIVPINLRLQRSKTEPTLYRYEFQFTCVRRLTSANARINMSERTWSDIANINYDIGSQVSALSEIMNEFKRGVS